MEEFTGSDKGTQVGHGDRVGSESVVLLGLDDEVAAVVRHAAEQRWRQLRVERRVASANKDIRSVDEVGVDPGGVVEDGRSRATLGVAP